MPVALAQDGKHRQSASFLTGTCEQLIVAGLDRSQTCRATVVNFHYRNGRTSFAFSDEAEALVSFSGIGEPPLGDRGSLAVDMITIALVEAGKEDVGSTAATGRCEYSDPFAGRAYIRCFGQTASGDYSAAFTSNGEPPDIQDF